MQNIVPDDKCITSMPKVTNATIGLSDLAGELAHAATVAIVGQVALDNLWHAMPSFPTLSELWLNSYKSTASSHVRPGRYAPPTHGVRHVPLMVSLSNP